MFNHNKVMLWMIKKKVERLKSSEKFSLKSEKKIPQIETEV